MDVKVVYEWNVCMYYLFTPLHVWYSRWGVTFVVFLSYIADEEDFTVSAENLNKIAVAFAS